MADRAGTVLSLGLVFMLGLASVRLGSRMAWSPRPGDVQIFPETVLHLALAPMPALEASPPEPVVELPPERMPEPEPPPEPEVAPTPALSPVSEPDVVLPPMEAMPATVAQPQIETEGDAGAEDAIRTEWLVQLRRRIEESKFYPGAARYAKETGTVLLRVEIGPSAEIGRVEVLENNGSPLLAEGALAILRRAAAKPLGTNTRPEGFRVDVPITYRLGRY